MPLETPIKFKRQTEIFNPEEFQEIITIIGAGNIGSNTAYGLAKLGMKYIQVFDFDKVEEHNLASQLYGIKDIGRLKVDCLWERIKDFTGIEIEKAGKYIDQRAHGILILAVDSMKERARIANVISNQAPRAIIDGRMGGNSIEVYTRNTAAEYKETLVSPGEVVDVSCSARYISYTSLLIAGIITNQVKRILKGEDIRRNVILDVDTLRLA